MKTSNLPIDEEQFSLGERVLCTLRSPRRDLTKPGSVIGFAKPKYGDLYFSYMVILDGNKRPQRVYHNQLEKLTDVNTRQTQINGA